LAKPWVVPKTLRKPIFIISMIFFNVCISTPALTMPVFLSETKESFEFAGHVIPYPPQTIRQRGNCERISSIPHGIHIATSFLYIEQGGHSGPMLHPKVKRTCNDRSFRFKF
jgi:hypothetical protein